MAKFIPLPLIIGMLGLLATGCGWGSKPVGVTAYQPDIQLSENAKRDTRPPITNPKDDDIKKTGTQEWTKGPQTQPQPKALEKEFAVIGKVSGAGAGSLTVDLDTGGQKSFQTDENTMVFRSGDPRFFALPGGVGGLGQGTAVQVIAFNKNGTDYARAVSVGDGNTFIVPTKGKGNK